MYSVMYINILVFQITDIHVMKLEQNHNMNVSYLEHLNVFQLSVHCNILESRIPDGSQIVQFAQRCFSSWLYNDLRVDLSVNKLSVTSVFKGHQVK